MEMAQSASAANSSRAADLAEVKQGPLAMEEAGGGRKQEEEVAEASSALSVLDFGSQVVRSRPRCRAPSTQSLCW